MSIQCLFIVHSMCIQYTFNVQSMFCYVLSVCLNDHSLTDLLSYPKSRDAIASKNKVIFGFRNLGVFDLFEAIFRVSGPIMLCLPRHIYG